MDRLNQLQTLLTDYVNTVDDVMRKRKPGEGILGMGGGPQDHPCHEQFDRQVQDMVQQWTAEPLSTNETVQLTACLLSSEDMGHGMQCAQLMLVAVQRHALSLIPMLSAAEAKRLLDGYTHRYPLFKRFPAQTEVIKALKKQCAQGH